MLRLIVSGVGIVALCAAACGDSGEGESGGGDPGGGGGANGGTGGTNTNGGGGASGDLSVSCDNPNNGARLCAEWVYPPEYEALVEDGIKSDCEPDGGTLGVTCDTTGAVGGCRLTDPGGAMGITVTTWVYTGTESDVMAYCTSLTAVFVSPP